MKYKSSDRNETNYNYCHYGNQVWISMQAHIKKMKKWQKKRENSVDENKKPFRMHKKHTERVVVTNTK